MAGETPQQAAQVNYMGYEILQAGQTPTPGKLYATGMYSSQLLRYNVYGSVEILSAASQGYNPAAPAPISPGAGGLYLTYEGGKTPVVSSIYTAGAVPYQGDPTKTSSVELPGQVGLFQGYSSPNGTDSKAQAPRYDSPNQPYSPVPAGGYYGMEGTVITDTQGVPLPVARGSTVSSQGGLPPQTDYPDMAGSPVPGAQGAYFTGSIAKADTSVGYTPPYMSTAGYTAPSVSPIFDPVGSAKGFISNPVGGVMAIGATAYGTTQMIKGVGDWWAGGVQKTTESGADAFSAALPQFSRQANVVESYASGLVGGIPAFVLSLPFAGAWTATHLTKPTDIGAKGYEILSQTVDEVVFKAEERRPGSGAGSFAAMFAGGKVLNPVLSPIITKATAPIGAAVGSVVDFGVARVPTGEMTLAGKPITVNYATLSVKAPWETYGASGRVVGGFAYGQGIPEVARVFIGSSDVPVDAIKASIKVYEIPAGIKPPSVFTTFNADLRAFDAARTFALDTAPNAVGNAVFKVTDYSYTKAIANAWYGAVEKIPVGNADLMALDVARTFALDTAPSALGNAFFRAMDYPYASSIAGALPTAGFADAWYRAVEHIPTGNADLLAFEAARTFALETAPRAAGNAFYKAMDYPYATTWYNAVEKVPVGNADLLAYEAARTFALDTAPDTVGNAFFKAMDYKYQPTNVALNVAAASWKFGIAGNMDLRAFDVVRTFALDTAPSAVARGFFKGMDYPLAEKLAPIGRYGADTWYNAIERVPAGNLDLRVFEKARTFALDTAPGAVGDVFFRAMDYPIASSIGSMPAVKFTADAWYNAVERIPSPGYGDLRAFDAARTFALDTAPELVGRGFFKAMDYPYATAYYNAVEKIPVGDMDLRAFDKARTFAVDTINEKMPYYAGSMQDIIKGFPVKMKFSSGDVLDIDTTPSSAVFAKNLFEIGKKSDPVLAELYQSYQITAQNVKNPILYQPTQVELFGELPTKWASKETMAKIFEASKKYDTLWGGSRGNIRPYSAPYARGSEHFGGSMKDFDILMPEKYIKPAFEEFKQIVESEPGRKVATTGGVGLYKNEGFQRFALTTADEASIKAETGKFLNAESFEEYPNMVPSKRTKVVTVGDQVVDIQGPGFGLEHKFSGATRGSTLTYSPEKGINLELKEAGRVKDFVDLSSIARSVARDLSKRTDSPIPEVAQESADRAYAAERLSVLAKEYGLKKAPEIQAMFDEFGKDILVEKTKPGVIQNAGTENQVAVGQSAPSGFDILAGRNVYGYGTGKNTGAVAVAENRGGQAGVKGTDVGIQESVTTQPKGGKYFTEDTLAKLPKTQEYVYPKVKAVAPEYPVGYGYPARAGAPAIAYPATYPATRAQETYPQSYPKSAQAQYPSSGAPYARRETPYTSRSSPYPSSETPYPTRGTTYPTRAAPYPTGEAPYPSRSAPVPTNQAPYPSRSTPIQGAGFIKEFKPYIEGIVPPTTEDTRRKRKLPRKAPAAFLETFSFDVKTSLPDGLAGVSPIPEARARLKSYRKSGLLAPGDGLKDPFSQSSPRKRKKR